MYLCAELFVGGRGPRYATLGAVLLVNRVPRLAPALFPLVSFERVRPSCHQCMIHLFCGFSGYDASGSSMNRR